MADAEEVIVEPTERASDVVPNLRLRDGESVEAVMPPEVWWVEVPVMDKAGQPRTNERDGTPRVEYVVHGLRLVRGNRPFDLTGGSGMLREIERTKMLFSLPKAIRLRRTGSGEDTRYLAVVIA